MRNPWPYLHIEEQHSLHHINCTGALPAPKDFATLVNMPCVLAKIGDGVNENGRGISETEKQLVVDDLKTALEEFIDREKGSSDVSDAAPFVTVNNGTNLLAVHSRLLMAFQVSIYKSIAKHKMAQNTGAFDQASAQSPKMKFKTTVCSWRRKRSRFAKARWSTAADSSTCVGSTGNATT